MHPDKFLGRQSEASKPRISEAERAERLDALGTVIAAKRKEAVEARKNSGIEDVWLACEEAYLGIDDMNRAQFAAAKWAKPTTMSGGLTRPTQRSIGNRSTAFVRLTSRYVDNAAAKMGEILFPIDDKAFSLEPTPDPDLILQAKDINTLLSDGNGQPIMHDLEPDEQVAPQGQDGAPQARPAQVPLTAGLLAQKLMDKAVECAKRAETKIYDWMTESKYPAEGRKIVHDASRIGTGVLKGPFPDMQESRALTKVKNVAALQIKRQVVPKMQWVDTWNIYPDDACGENVHDGDYIFECDFLSKKMLNNLKKQVEQGYLPEQIDQVIKEGPGKIYADGGNPNEKDSDRKRYQIWYYYGLIKRDDMMLANAIGIEDIPEDQEEVHAIVSLVNNTVIRAIINPLDSGAFPYRVMTWSRRPGHWAGVGVGEQMEMPQRAVNAATRSMFNNAGLSSGVQIVISQTGIAPADGSYEITPNKVWYATGDVVDVAKAFSCVEIPSVQNELMNIITYGMKLAEESTGIPLITQGQTGPTSPETFGQAELQDTNAHTWLRSVGYRFDDQITEPLVNDLYEWLLLDPRIPDDDKGDFKINAHGSIAMVERAIQESTLLGLLGAALQPAYGMDPKKITAQYLKAKRLDPREIQYTEAEQEEKDKQPPPPPVQLQVEQMRGQNAIKTVQEKAKADIVVAQQESQLDQQAEAAGGHSPHMVSAAAAIKQEEIKAASNERTEASRANAEQMRAQKEFDIAQQNGQFKLEELRLKREIAILEYTNKQQITLQQAQSQLAQTALQEKTKREMGAAEIQLAVSEGDANRQVDAHKHHMSLIRDQINTENTP